MTWDAVLMRLRHSSFLYRLMLTHVAPWIRVSIAWNRFFNIRAANAVDHVESAWCVRSIHYSYTIRTATLRTDWIRLSWYIGSPARMLLQQSTLVITKEFTRRVATVVVRERQINLIRRSWLKHERTRRVTCSVMDILWSKYAPRLRSVDDTFTKPSGRTKADLSIRYVWRCEAHHMNTDLDGFNMSRSLDIQSPIDLMHVIILDFKAAHSRWLKDEYSWLSSA